MIAQEQGENSGRKEVCTMDTVSRIKNYSYYQNTTYSHLLPFPTISFKKSSFHYVLNNVLFSGF